jgi:hypothetical protein
MKIKIAISLLLANLIQSFLLNNILKAAENTPDITHGCWYKQIDKPHDKRTLSLCFQSDDQMHIVHGEIGADLDAAPAVWSFKKHNKILIDTETCNLKHFGSDTLELSGCPFKGVFVRK